MVHPPHDYDTRVARYMDIYMDLSLYIFEAMTRFEPHPFREETSNPLATLYIARRYSEAAQVKSTLVQDSSMSSSWYCTLHYTSGVLEIATAPYGVYRADRCRCARIQLQTFPAFAGSSIHPVSSVVCRPSLSIQSTYEKIARLNTFTLLLCVKCTKRQDSYGAPKLQKMF